MPRLIFLSGIVLFFQINASSQVQTNIDSIKPFSQTVQNSINKKIADVSRSFDKELARQQKKIEKQDRRIYAQLRKKDSLVAELYLQQSSYAVKLLKQNLSGNLSNASHYVPHVDSLTVIFQFLKQQSAEGTQNVKRNLQSISSLNEMQEKLNKAALLKKFLQDRRNHLYGSFNKIELFKELKRANKQVYYYSQQLNEYKTILKDRKRAEKKAIELISRTKKFREFMERNSMLASFFSIPGNSSAANFSNPALQTRQQIQQMLTSQFQSTTSPALFQQRMTQAQQQFNNIRSQLNTKGMGNSDEDLPDFKPNNQKTKSFLKRVEVGTNLQTVRNVNIMPARADMAISLGYKLNDKSIIGIGGAYKLGLGSLRRINITHEGIGLRSFIDWKIKGGFWLSGGYELNYHASFERLNLLKKYNAWQPSGLLGVSKKLNIKTKFFNASKLQLLYDFMYRKNMPGSQPLVFRVGYSF